MKMILGSQYWQDYMCNMYKGAKLVGAVGARAPTLFLPRPEFAHIWG